MVENVIQIKSGTSINIGGSLYEKDYIWNPATYSYKNGKYLASITDYMWWNYSGNKNSSNEF